MDDLTARHDVYCEGGQCRCFSAVDSDLIAPRHPLRLLRDLRARVRALADEWQATERAMGCLNAAHRLRALLTEADDD